MRRLWMLIMLGVLTAGVAMSTVQWVAPDQAAIHAQEEGQDGEGGGGKQQTLLQTIIAGGVPEFMIILMSVVGLALIIEHAVSIRREKLVPPYLLSELEGMFDEEDFEEAMDAIENEQNFLGRVVFAGLSKMGLGKDSVTMAVAGATEEEATVLHQKISYLSLIASVAPMMGLLGTVMGMITAFNKIAIMHGVATPGDLAGGIGQALITTLSGLIVAIPVLCAYLFFRNRVVRIVQEVEKTTIDLMDRMNQPAE